MSGNFTQAKAARGLRNLRSELKRGPTPERRAVIERQIVENYLPYLENHCVRCGILLTDPESLRLRMGPECRRLLADPRDDFTSAEHADEAADQGAADDVIGDVA